VNAPRFPRAAVATPHYLASATGLAVLAGGGNAVDAAVAAILTLGVVAPYLCGFGGDLFAVVWDGDLNGYLGSGRSAAEASLDAVAARAGTPHMPVLGPDSVTVPGGVAGWFDLLGRWGTRDFGTLAADAVAYAHDGFPVTAAAAPVFAEAARMYRRDPWFERWQRVYGDVTAGSWLRQPALARTIERIAQDGPDAYYRGPIGEAIVATLSEDGADLRQGDFAAHVGEWVPPLRAAYRDVEVAELPPPTQGVTALEALRILDGGPLPAPGPAREHLLIEALKQALADRDRYVTEPTAMPRPATELLAEPFVASRRDALRADRAVPPGVGVTQPGGTAYLCASDADGLLVSLIQSNFMSFGSGIHVSDWGINLNNRGFSFSLDPTHPNRFEPGKRPLHTLIPALGLRDGRPWLVFGSMGGDAQTAVHVQLLAHLVDEGADPADALRAPRWRVDPGRWTVHAEARFAPDVLEGLRARGHEVIDAPAYDARMGHAHVIRLESTGYAAASDPRSEGAALGR
jgi:gamma-glutamyltranspeptidase / glutathione hydrolase